MSRSVARSRVVNAPPQAVFDVLADPRMHPAIDGSGTVRAVVAGPDRLSIGARFGMHMHRGMPYVIRNTVVEFEEGRLIAWRHWAGHRWRYRLEPVAEGTLVTETFDWSTGRSPWLLERLGFPAANVPGMVATLERLAQVLAERPEVVP